ncbi:hypothetical protein CLV24_115107 [Pontibacter ummariensis]|uniref:Uncharacterized protein n=1 Tax=Pontibacter ummariensis TaxID=1610492 RepID=A0A239I2L2_9BACT|nr:hypothetical protein [Pontibacter ummariensis]PRY10190.1 hypothetical protein CLV24_115107 [Pontibacter ummariensis]SNS87759.1 hypothetical protein SAMN06296052_115107 [Pontibacter ummariensis]
MRLTGNLRDIKTQRDDQLQDIVLHIDKVEYLTQKKDGKYFQPFEFVDELDTPLVITGDRLSRTDTKHLEEGEHEFNVYDKVDGAYELNPNKHLSVTTEYDFDLDLTILTSVSYVVTVSNEEFTEIKQEKHKARKGKRRHR